MTVNSPVTSTVKIAERESEKAMGTPKTISSRKPPTNKTAYPAKLIYAASFSAFAVGASSGLRLRIRSIRCTIENAQPMG